ncbi:MAG: heterodisulfide reductase-related iron-sulfur binding cluster, partial [Chloroflexota bacterium]|nr:heterodisulfide reductase-related iron-sulfur binding cluster [Chloroflexota bacterium]
TEEPPRLSLIEECVHCGFCLPTCPTYVLWGEEMDSPRGRIYLMKVGLEGAPLSDSMVRHFDLCLGCLACVTACPSGVQYEKLIESTRQQVERRYARTVGDRYFRHLVFALFPHPSRLRALSPALRLYQRYSVGNRLRRTGLMSRLPLRLQAMEALMPRVPARALRAGPPAVSPAQGRQRARVGLLTGCVQSVFFPEINQATARVLSADGCEVVAPRGQSCCGALSLHSGREREAQELARATIDAFERTGTDYVVVNAAGCGSTLKQYGYLLRDDPVYAARAENFAAKVRDVSELVAELGPVAERHPLPLSAAYHDACHLAHGQSLRQEPRACLRAIPGLELREIAESEICCGSAGIYNLVEPEAAADLGRRKAGHVLQAGASLCVTANPGCLLQIRTSLRGLGRALPKAHPVEVIDASIQGRDSEAFLSALQLRS